MKRVVQTDRAPKALGPYSVAVESGSMVFLSGQVGIDPATGKLASDAVAGQAEQVMKNVAAVLDAAGCSIEDVVKTTIFLADMADFSAVNEIYGSCFSGDYPARSTVAVKDLPIGARVEIEVIAMK
jgi:2-iminobutanoate/2-iminopropanoate deaminase